MNYLTFLTLLLIIFNIPSTYLFDFNKTSNINKWVVVDDGVMGGLSEGTMQLNSQGHGIFSGYVTTANNGGFSSVRHSITQKSVADFTHVVLKIKGDGKKYQFRIKKSRYDRASYVSTFQTSGEWETVKLPLKDFYPSFRGYKLSRPNYDGSSLAEITFLIANKKNEYFSLLIDSILME